MKTVKNLSSKRLQCGAMGMYVALCLVLNLLKAQLSTGVLFQLFHLLSDVYHVTVRCIRVALRKARELCVVHNCQRVPTLVTRSMTLVILVSPTDGKLCACSDRWSLDGGRTSDGRPVDLIETRNQQNASIRN